MHIPNVAFLVPGVRSFVGWEARRDARRAVRSDQALLLGYLHHDNVGELDGCVVGDYQAGVETQSVPQWLGYNADGVLAIECEGSPNAISLQVPVLESGNPLDEYQVVYGKAFNNEIVRLMRSAVGGGRASNTELNLTATALACARAAPAG